MDVLAEGWRKCRANGGVAGVDGVRFEDIEAQPRLRLGSERVFGLNSGRAYELNALLAKFDLLHLFAAPPGWAQLPDTAQM